MGWGNQVEFSSLVGKTLTSIEGAIAGEYEIIFTTSAGEKFKMHHEQDCCESVHLSDVEGDISDLIGSPIVIAEEADSYDHPAPPGEYVESYTWTFYRIATAKGFVVLRWLGESNGYYSESVDFERIP